MVSVMLPAGAGRRLGVVNARRLSSTECRAQATACNGNNAIHRLALVGIYNIIIEIELGLHV